MDRAKAYFLTLEKGLLAQRDDGYRAALINAEIVKFEGYLTDHECDACRANFARTTVRYILIHLASYRNQIERKIRDRISAAEAVLDYREDYEILSAMVAAE